MDRNEENHEIIQQIKQIQDLFFCKKQFKHKNKVQNEESYDQRVKILANLCKEFKINLSTKEKYDFDKKIEMMADLTAGFNARDLHLLFFETIRLHSLKTLNMIQFCKKNFKDANQ